MKNWIFRLRRLGAKTITGQTDRALEQTCAGRLINAMMFLFVILCLSLWITVFLLLKDRLFSETLSGNVLTNLTCVTFFGGLTAAIIIGALAGNFLRRVFWKILIKRKNRQ